MSDPLMMLPAIPPSLWITAEHTLKTLKDGKWLVVGSVGDFQEVKEDNLADAPRFKIEKAFSSRTTKQGRNQA
jgi:hypothetical protein